MCIIFLDEDNFKLINDNFGHLTGDNIIKESSDKLSKIFNKNDILSRFGGDEFCIFLTDCLLIEEKFNLINTKLNTVYSRNKLTVIVSAIIENDFHLHMIFFLLYFYQIIKYGKV